ncbi:tricorn protease domain 2-containing protein [Coniophora puteana RWD-64-598 SS2]|uniref:Tricorn protease domain 2-containing protein n=1 Tax=Coniophora puteana (strain RWD-64-598) TaxID=741705 RepID=A0A5M3MBK6_CONPW|nr:tricorn protease domain 2-containing protein [Coniophora puteana RWD-64-598 SS2]EIW76274.1 tricorn protease domain 2-containing protein [Coniophora puteana RWD-64-598 SS2]
MSQRASSQADSDDGPLPFTFHDGEDDSEPPVVTCVEYSPDGQSIATGAHDSTVRFWDAKTGQETRRLTSGHPVLWISFSRSGRRLAAICLSSDAERAHVVDGQWVIDGSEAGTTCVWDVSTGKKVAGPFIMEHRAHYDRAVTAITCSPSKDHLVCVVNEKEVYVWDLHTCKIALSSVRPSCHPRLSFEDVCAFQIPQRKAELPHLCHPAYGGGVTAIHAFPDGRRFVSSTFDDHYIRIWDVQTGKQVKEFSFPGGCNIALSEDGSLLAAGSTKRFGCVTLLDANSGEEYSPPLLGAGSQTQKLLFSSDSSVLAVIINDGGLRLVHDVLGDREINVIAVKDVIDVAFSPDGIHLAYVTHTGNTLLCNVCDAATTTVTIEPQRPGPESDLNLTFLPDGKSLLRTSDQNKARIWDITTGQNVVKYTLSSRSQALSAVSPDGKTFLYGWVKSEDEFRLEMIDVVSGKRVWLITETVSITAIAFVPAGDKVVVGSTNGTLQVLETSTGRILLRHIDDRRSSVELVSGAQSLSTHSNDSSFVYYSRTPLLNCKEGALALRTGTMTRL